MNYLFTNYYSYHKPNVDVLSRDMLLIYVYSVVFTGIYVKDFKNSS